MESAASDRADPAGVDGGGLAVSVVAWVEGCDGRAGGPVESGGTGAEVVAGAVCADVAAAAGVDGSGCVAPLSVVVAWSGCTTGGKTEKGCCCQTPCCGPHERMVVNCVGWLGGGEIAMGVGCVAAVGGGEGVGMVTGSCVGKL